MKTLVLGFQVFLAIDQSRWLKYLEISRRLIFKIES